MSIDGKKLACDDCVTVAMAGSDELGEGPHWSEAEQTLYWVDIVNPALQSFAIGPSGDPDVTTLQRRSLTEQTGVVVPACSGGFIAASESGILTINADMSLNPIAEPESDRPNNRFNDGKCDSHGRLWASSLSMKGEKGQASLWRIDPDHTITRMLDDIDIGNGLGWNDDESTFYFTDSGKATIYRFDFNADTGTLGERQVFVAPDASRDGVPDGLAVDDEGHVWSAQWDGACVIRYAPDGSIDRIVRVPVHRPTSCAFGGKNGSTLFVTSARVGLSDDQLAEAPLSGSVFAIESGTTGKTGNLFGRNR
ncbi:SMP-30/gluconolactonase/LRE family protein [Granulosicoccus sp. 3-233]|uniref:SMP-30/gluconolactonase/LRE family protein n=1 Tax=Granulosicoccus sp. 3-233 TaxID=3417969 RepID=UPI003D33F539